MLLLVGLGNPGEKYARHRHNVGFMAADAIADANGFGPARSKFQGEIRDGTLGREKALILKPQTFMNDSGQAVGEAARFYKIPPEDIIVFYDELDLATGKLRVKIGGGAAGHNGIRSIDSHIGNSFKRIRIGIGHPGDKSRVTNHVLGDFAKSDQDWLTPMLNAIASEAAYLAEPDANRFATAVAQKLAPPKKEVGPKQQTDSTKAGREPIAEQSERSPSNPFADAFKKLTGGGEND
ncbi:aminoacyl-tRNA hydrolase [Hyphococcus sp.]|uniref:aminoacyl-tRNA hydrolase n=1 Tax=Hyphococcus sp. TaxID=2038636 RepID=UPI002082C2B0|nr:MAG: peptidyl-tRNA hydrolase [Marinicaulis sp.]